MSVQQEHRSAFLSQMNEADNENDRRQVDRDVEDTFLPQYISESERVLMELEQEAIKQMASELGIPESDLEIELSDKVQFQATNIAKEMFNRAHGNFREQMADSIETDNDPDDDPVSTVDLLAAATITGIAAKAVSTAFNQGREEVIDVVVEVTGGDLPVATRSAVMDSGTCGPCKELDGKEYEYDSDEYRANKPPNFCKGRGRCRCIMTYSIPIDIDAF